MSYSLFLQCARQTLAELIKEYDPKTHRANFNPTGFEPCAFHPFGRPFLYQIETLNSFVYTTASSVEPWDEGTLWIDNADQLLIIFFTLKTQYEALKTWASQNGYLLTKSPNQEAEFHHLCDRYQKKSNIDFSGLKDELIQVELLDPEHDRKTLFIELAYFYANLCKNDEQFEQSVIKEIESDNEWHLDRTLCANWKTDVILDDLNVKRAIVKLEKLRQFVDVFYHPAFTMYCKYRLGVSDAIYQKIIQSNQVRIEPVHDLENERSGFFKSRQPEKPCDRHIIVEVLDTSSVSHQIQKLIDLVA